MRRSQNVYAGSAQEVTGANQRQADEGGGIIVFDACKQCDAKAFALGAASAVVGLLCLQILLDLLVAELAKGHLNSGQFRLLKSGVATHHRHSRLKYHGFASHALQLRDRSLVGARFAQRLAV